jgi:hypothetical protein
MSARNSNLLRRLARKLTPVVVDLGSARPRFESMLDRDRSGAIVLAPIGLPASEPLPALGSVRVRSSDPGEPWMILCRGVAMNGQRAAQLDLDGARLERMPPRLPIRSLPTAMRQPILVAWSADWTSNQRVFPMIEVTGSRGTIETTSPLWAEGTVAVDIVGDEQIVRTARARLVESIPWVGPDGTRRLRCRLAFEERAVRDGDDAVDVLSGTAVARLLERAAASKSACWYRLAEGPRKRAVVAAVHDGVVSIAIARSPGATSAAASLQLGFELLGMSYEMEPSAASVQGDCIVASIPPVARRHQRRWEQRVTLQATQGATVLSYRDPATGVAGQGKVRDLSMRGICFEVRGTPIWRGASLENARVETPRRVELGELVVRNVEAAGEGNVLCHAARAPRAVPELLDFLIAHRYPDLRRHDGRDFAAMVGLYEQLGLLQPHMHDGLRPLRDEVAEDWRKLHDPRAGIGYTFLLQRADGAPRGAISFVRAWDKTWMVQNFGTLVGAEPGAAAALRLAVLDMVMPRADGHYVTFFVRANNFAMHASFERFFSLRKHSEVASRVDLARWALPSARAGNGGGEELERISGLGETFAARVARGALGAIAANGLSMVPGALTLRRTSRNFHGVGLERKRTCFALSNGDRPGAILIEERTSPGVSLPGTLDAWWYLPASEEQENEATIARAAEAIACRPRARERKLLLLPRGMPEAPLYAAGYKRLADVCLYTLNRAGIHRYHAELVERRNALLVAIDLRRACAARRAR